MPKRKTPKRENKDASEQTVTGQAEAETQQTKDADSETSSKGRKKAASKKTSRKSPNAKSSSTKSSSAKSKAKAKAEETKASSDGLDDKTDAKPAKTATRTTTRKKAASKKAASKKAASKKAATTQAAEDTAEASTEAQSAEDQSAEDQSAEDQATADTDKPKRKRKAASKKATKQAADENAASNEATEEKTAGKKTPAKTTRKKAASKGAASKKATASEEITAPATPPKPARKPARNRKASTTAAASGAAAEGAETAADQPAADKRKTAAKRATTKRTAAKRASSAQSTQADAPAAPDEAETPASSNLPDPSLPDPHPLDLSTEPLVLQRSKAKTGPRAEGDEVPLDELSGVEAVNPATDNILAGPLAGPQAIADLPELDALSELPPMPKLDDPAQQMLLEQLREIGRPIHVKDLEKSFTRREADVVGGWRDINDVLDELTRAGLVVRTRRRTYGLPEAMNLVRGRFQAASAGFGFVIPDAGRDDYYIPAEDTMEAWNGDTVLVRPEGHGPRGGGGGAGSGRGRGGRGGRGGSRSHTPRHGNPQATVVRIIERKASQLVGTLEFSHGYPMLKADDFRARHRIFVLPNEAEGLEAGSRVVVKLYWPEDTGEDEVFGEIVRVLGEQDDPVTETEAVIVTYGLRGEFPDEVLAEAQAIPNQIPDQALAGRMDLRAANTFTVDGRDAKDFDDAIHIQATERGTFVVGVHIADVSHYVRAGSQLDQEAYARATSVYLPGRVLPMLPEHLSNGVCSLVPNEDRLTMSALIELSSDAEILDVQLTPSVIHSKARLTYDEVQAYSEATSPLPEHARALEGDLHLLLKMAAKLRALRLRDGSLNFKLREVKVDIDAGGRLKLTELREETARGMIEDLMLLANKVVAKFLKSKGIPALFRIHEEPTLQRFQEAAGALGRLGLGFPGGEPTPQAYQTVLGQVRGTPRESVVNTLLLRSMQQAKYSPENLGHFGLAFEDYLHFTSPIRRYPDLLVHRILREVLAGHLKGGTSEVAELRAILPPMAEHTSERERAATEAERDLTKYYQAKWAENYVGQSFMGRVSGVVASGLFVALDNGVEGKLHISNLEDDYYIYLEDAQILKGRSRGRLFRLGDAVAVTISAAKPLARQIDFTVPEEGTELSVIGEDDEKQKPDPPKTK